MLLCDRSQHRHYGDDQGRYWSVSQVLQILTGDRTYSDTQAMQRGTDVHQIFALLIGQRMGWCEEPEIPYEYQGHANGVRNWIQHANPKPTMLERSLRHKTLPYAGTMDYVGMPDDEYGVLDLKTGTPEKWHEVQLHAYKQLIDKTSRMWILYINSEGGFKQVTVKNNPRHWAAFQNGLSVLQWRESA